MTRLSCHRFRSNQVRLALSLLAYNLGNLRRRLALPPRIESWSSMSLQQRLVKTGGRLVKHARYYWLLLVEGHLTRRRFGAMPDRVGVATGTDGIEKAAGHPRGMCLPRCWGKEECCESGLNSGVILAVMLLIGGL